MQKKELQVKCKICNDTGWRLIWPNRGVPCECRYNRRVDIMKALNIPPLFYQASLNDFDFLGRHQDVIDKVKEYIENKEYKTGRGFYFYGSSGVGKTHLAVAILKRIYKVHGVAGLFYDLQSFLYDLRATFNGSSDEFYNTVDFLNFTVTTPLLVLDDLDIEYFSDWGKDALNYVINERYKMMRPVIITSNYELNGVSLNTVEEKLGRRIASRLLEMCYIIKMEGEDLRSTARRVDIRPF